ncbi:transglutaminase-like domain-containing protein [Allohahella sp. A8]|uniref:transglutaminase-like domain-containing protein n=1 Tax=Allohahella sp. A8 TaxID=3141461 RepID=UPI000C09DBF4|nr:transglutaminase [Hahellaceae bacterium]
MQIQIGFTLIYECPQPTPMILMLSVHSSRSHDMVVPDELKSNPSVPFRNYIDNFGNWCTRLVAPAGELVLTADGVFSDSGEIDPQTPAAQQHPVQDLPDDVLTYLTGSRYCETDLLSETAWQLFGGTPAGWYRVQAICDFVHDHIRFDYQRTRPTMTAKDVYSERTGVCRDFTHLAIAFCRCLNIPARYCSGYLSDVGLPPPYPPQDFAAWFEVYLNGSWHTFDVRNNSPRRGRILMTRGRDAGDVPLSTTFGPNTLKLFEVRCEPY